jgi:preprotein translocase subunit SecD
LGRTAKAAVDDGYTNAMNAVVDANITTFLSGVVLYQFGTGPIRGFAVTLIIGIISTMYTVIIGTWLVYDYLFIRRKMTRMSL